MRCQVLKTIVFDIPNVYSYPMTTTKPSSDEFANIGKPNNVHVFNKTVGHNSSKPVWTVQGRGIHSLSQD